MTNTNNTETTSSKAPSHVVYQERDSGNAKFWTRVGVAWSHSEGKGFNVQLDFVPLDGGLTLRIAREIK